MSNPVVTVSNYIPEPSDPSTVRKSYMMKVFDSVYFFLYSEGQSFSTFDPTKNGNEFYLWYQLGDSLIGLPLPAPPPAFITTGSWTGVKATPSGFVTTNNSVMPKILGPSTLLVDNGIQMAQQAYTALWNDSGTWKELFNWVIDKVNGVAVGPASPDWFRYGQVGANFGSLYASIKAKDDKQASNTVEMSLPALTDPPTGDWDSSSLVGGGAFMLMLNILGTTPGQAAPTDNEENRWSIVISFGDVTMTIADASTMKVNIAGGGANGNDTTVNLAEGASKEGPPQQQHMADKAPLLIGVYPVWNGIVVTSGSQDTREVTRTASTYCRKFKSATIQDPIYSTWFNPQTPANVEVGVGSPGPTDVRVGFGTTISVVAKNCRFEIAYLPRFFTKVLDFDGWLLLEKDSDEITYNYNIYTIYTKNGTDYDFVTAPTITSSAYDGTVDGTHYFYANWKMKTVANIYQRWAVEIFAYILETKETRTYSIKNGNGNFTLTWAGGTPGDSAPSDWTKYIKSVSVTTGIDGSSGNIVVDKYGVAGQDAVATQSIGAVVLDAIGGVGTVPGTIFQGLGMGISNAEASNDSTWTIPLIGLEKKLDDIALINPPYMDGETLATAVDYLCRYAGIQYDMSAANAGVRLSATEEINAARFDWKSGTSVKTALEEVLQDVLHWYCVRDGKVFIYQLSDNGLPVMLGPDRSGGYDFTNMVNIDKTPDFEDLRNYIVAMALQQVPDGQGTKIDAVPTFPVIEARTKATVPDVPWAKCWVRVFPGTLDQATLSNIADRMSKMSSVYELTGKLTIPGNADIKPYDQWGDLVVSSVTHSVDLASKTWTTDLEFMRNTT